MNPLKSAARLAALLTLASASINPAPAQSRNIQESPSLTTSATARTPLPDFTQLARQHSPAIVNISSQKQAGRSSLKTRSGIVPTDALHELLRRFGFPGQRPDTASRMSASGFIIDAEGHILTSAHVVDGADEVMVGLSDKRQFAATVMGIDKSTDIALLKIPSGNLPFVKIGDPEKLEVGEWIFAIGAPFGLANTVTQGIVSAKGRDIPNENIIPFIQTDAAINPGNSGGPLFNMRGEVVGINALIFSHNGGYMGISFAIPIDVAFQIKDKLLKDGSIRRGRLGLIIQEMTGELAESFRLPHVRGVLIAALETTGVNDLGGLIPGDIVLEFNGISITGPAELSRMVAESTPGARVPLKFWRDAKMMETQVRPSEMAADTKRTPPERLAIERLGLILLELGRVERQAAGTEGVLMIEAVDGVAAKAGLQPGDMVLGINNKKIFNLDQFRQALKQGRKQIALLIERDGNGDVFIPIPLE